MSQQRACLPNVKERASGATAWDKESGEGVTKTVGCHEVEKRLERGWWDGKTVGCHQLPPQVGDSVPHQAEVMR